MTEIPGDREGADQREEEESRHNYKDVGREDSDTTLTHVMFQVVVAKIGIDYEESCDDKESHDDLVASRHIPRACGAGGDSEMEGNQRKGKEIPDSIEPVSLPDAIDGGLCKNLFPCHHQAKLHQINDICKEREMGYENLWIKNVGKSIISCNFADVTILIECEINVKKDYMIRNIISGLLLFMSIGWFSTVKAQEAGLVDIFSLKANAEKGYDLSQCLLGSYYYNGKGFDQNYEEAAKWFRKAAGQGLADAQYYLGECYENGHGVAADEKVAAQWYRKAAKQGNAKGEWKTGLCYAGGKGVKQNYKKAAKWLRKAAQQGNDDAQLDLGLLYAGGYGVTQSYKEAIAWTRKSAEQGNPNAQLYMGNYYKNGLGVEPDKGEAARWYEKAASQGLDKAKERLAEMVDG